MTYVDDKRELEEFKTRIDLRVYAASHGYQLDERSWRGSAVMRHPATDDKVVIKRDIDGHYVYYSVRDDRDNGSIIDWVQNRNRTMKLGSVRRELRPWIGVPPVTVPSFPPLPNTPKDRLKVEAAYARMKDASSGHPYLERQRCIPPALLSLDRFAGRIKIDSRGNAVFPHFDQDGLSGYELRNEGFKGFSSGGSKSLWLSDEFASDKRLVFCESAIECLSYAVLFPANDARYASVGGKTSPQQLELIRASAARMPIDAEIVSAMNADAAGRELAQTVRRAVELSGRHDLRFVSQEPAGYNDWNDQLRARPHPLLPCRPDVPFVA